MQPSSPSPVSSRKKSLWPYGITAALMLVVGVNLVMVSIAYRHPSAAATHEHWREAVEFNDEFARRQETANLGWHIQVVPCKGGLDGEATSDGRACDLTIVVNDRNEQPLRQLSGEIELRRGDSEAFDRQGTLQESADGSYIAKLHLAAGGNYRARVKLSGTQGTWHGEESVRIETLGP